VAGNTQLSKTPSHTCGPYYRYTRDKATSFTHEGENIDVPKTNRHSFGIRGGVRF